MKLTLTQEGEEEKSRLTQPNPSSILDEETQQTLKQLQGIWFDVVHDMVSIWYPDGDFCARIQGNLGLDISAEDVAKALCQLVNTTICLQDSNVKPTDN